MNSEHKRFHFKYFWNFKKFFMFIGVQPTSIYVCMCTRSMPSVQVGQKRA